MKRTWTIIDVGDVPRSLKWYQSLLGRLHLELRLMWNVPACPCWANSRKLRPPFRSKEVNNCESFAGLPD
jgi:hypothetical protein